MLLMNTTTDSFTFRPIYLWLSLALSCRQLQSKRSSQTCSLWFIFSFTKTNWLRYPFTICIGLWHDEWKLLHSKPFTSEAFCYVFKFMSLLLQCYPRLVFSSLSLSLSTSSHVKLMLVNHRLNSRHTTVINFLFMLRNILLFLFWLEQMKASLKHISRFLN